MIKQSRYFDVVSTLKACGNFLSSEEYLRLSGEMDDLPGVIAAAFARYLNRMVVVGNECEVDSCLDAISELSSWRDPMVDTMIRDEIIELLNGK